MVVFSSLRGPAVASIRAALQQANAARITKPLSQNIVQVRHMGENRMVIKPSSYDYQQWKDNVHYFLLLNLVPILAITFGVNVFVGPSDLAEIPEDYVPKHWEYHKSPIKRLFSKYMYDSYEKEYEKTCAVIACEEAKRKKRLQWEKMRKIQGETVNFRGWFYYPVDKSNIDNHRKEMDDFYETLGTSIK